MSQSLSRLWTHIIFSTKQRSPLLKNFTLRTRIFDYIKQICEKHSCQTLIVGGAEDHVHILTNLHKNTSLANLVMEIKKSSARWVNITNEIEAQLYWQRGYGAFSVSQSSLAIVKNYIEQQDVHHRKISFKDELRKFFLQHNIEYDERYLWD